MCSLRSGPLVCQDEVVARNGAVARNDERQTGYSDFKMKMMIEQTEDFCLYDRCLGSSSALRRCQGEGAGDADEGAGVAPAT